MGDLGASTLEVNALFKSALNQGIGSGMAAAWGRIDDLKADPIQFSKIQTAVAGKLWHDSQALPVLTTSQFDLASLTKILATTSLFMILDEEGVIKVEDELSVYLPDEVKQYPHLKGVTIASLLSHTSGLPAWKPIFEEMRSKFGPNLPFVDLLSRRSFFYHEVFKVLPDHQPGQKMVYSDLGFILLCYVIENQFKGQLFHQVVQDQVWSRVFGVAKGLQYFPVLTDSEGMRAHLACAGHSVVASEVCPWRGLLQGQVHDDNTWSFGGISSHAGVFGSLVDVLSWTEALLRFKIVSKLTLQKFFKESLLSGLPGMPASGRALGFDLASKNGNGSTAFAFQNHTVGHLGFAGTSIWIDVDEGFFAILLTNQKSGPELKRLRQTFHTIIHPA